MGAHNSQQCCLPTSALLTKGNDLFYVYSLIEYIGRVTKNRRGAVVGVSGARMVSAALLQIMLYMTA